MATPRHGKSFLWVTWLAKLLAGDQCLWRVWFQSRHSYVKFEPRKFDLAQWNREHNELMRRRRLELEREGFLVTAEDANAFRLHGQAAVLCGKPDLVATKPGLALVVDGKTGRERDSDLWQVLLYLYALPKCRPDLVKDCALEGEVQYGQTDERITVTPDELTPERVEQVVTVIRAVSGAQAPARVPSLHECERCNVGPSDCPQRVTEAPAVLTTAF